MTCVLAISEFISSVWGLCLIYNRIQLGGRNPVSFKQRNNHKEPCPLWLFFGADNHKGHEKTLYLRGFAAIGNVYIFLITICAQFDWHNGKYPRSKIRLFK